MRNKSSPEGSIAEGYLADECLTFCSRYLGSGVETRFNRPGRNDDDDDGDVSSGGRFSVFAGNGRPLGRKTTLDSKKTNENTRQLTDEEWEQARLYVLVNCDEVTPFIE